MGEKELIESLKSSEARWKERVLNPASLHAFRHFRI